MTRNNTTLSVLRILQIIFFLSAILYFGGGLLIPMLYGLLIAIVLYPMCRKLENLGWPRSLAISLGLTIVILLTAGLVLLFIMQLNMLRDELPGLLARLKPAVNSVGEWIGTTLGLSPETQQKWWSARLDDFGESLGSIAQSTLSNTAGSILGVLLVPVYTVLFLYERKAFVSFISRIAGSRLRPRLHVILDDVVHSYSNFIKGMVMVYLIVGCLNSLGLMLLGIPHAVLFGMLTAIMTIIPYVGIFISALVPISVAWITKDSAWYAVGVAGVFALVQYLEANVIFPRVVGGRLKVSTWAMLVAVLSGGLIWGVSGMILFIPFVGMLKIILQYIPEFSSLSLLIDREQSDTTGEKRETKKRKLTIDD